MKTPKSGKGSTEPPIPPEQAEEAARLKAAFDEQKAAGRELSQDTLAAALEVTQGAISHFMTGRRPLTVRRLRQFCQQMGTQPASISPRLVNQARDQLQEAQALLQLVAAAPMAAEPAAPYGEPSLSAAERELLRYMRQMADDEQHSDRIAMAAMILLRAFVENAVPDALLELNGWSAKSKKEQDA